MASEPGPSAPRRRITALGLAALVQAGVLALIIFGFAPPAALQGPIERLTSIEMTPPSPSPSPHPPSPVAQASPAGASGAEGRKAVAREDAAPVPRVTIAPEAFAPPVASTGNANASGARDAGAGTGAGGTGQGTGSGAGGNGSGGGSKPVKLAGEINSAADYPRESRELRIGDYVIVVLTVGTDGRVSGCRIQRPSRDSAADAVTCRLAMQRFRFRPGTDAAGNPVESLYGWKQSWFL
jgi:protein TonB